ncbi:MAG: heme ABC transporter permease CcmB [Calditrichaeota bacterium]|nr:MAG: heme ABC transporter permease CcmB [Calditrichota bacterium]
MIAKIAAVLWKDLLSEFRTKEMIVSMLVFSLMVALIFNFSFPTGSEFIRGAFPGILWMTFIFASLLGMNRSFVYEVDKGCLQGLMIAPIDRMVIYLSKLVVNFIFISLVEFITLPIFSIFFDVDVLPALGQLLLVVVLSTVGLAVVGTLFSAISVNTKTREVMLPILHLPVSVPILISAVEATRAIFQNGSWGEVWGWLKLLIVFDAIFLVVALWTFEYVIEE